MVATISGVTYAHLADRIQNNIYELLSNDTNITTNYTVNIHGGMPPDLWRGRGFPYILVRTATLDSERFTQTRFKVNTETEIEIYSKTENLARELADAVRNTLKTSQEETRTDGGMCLYHITSSDITPTFISPESSKPVWVYTLVVSYTCYVS